MKTIFTFLSLVVFIVSCTKEPNYHNTDFNISLNKPEKWEITADSINNILHIISPLEEEDEFQEMINVVKGKTLGLSLDDFFEKNLKAVEGMFEELNQTQSPTLTTINGRTFKKVKYNYVFQGYPLTADLFVTLTEDASYVINCSALQNTYDNFQEKFESVINSIEIN